jgi:hypothetical protein
MNFDTIWTERSETIKIGAEISDLLIRMLITFDSTSVSSFHWIYVNNDGLRNEKNMI